MYFLIGISHCPHDLLKSSTKCRILNYETSKKGKIISYVVFTGGVPFNGFYVMVLAFVSQESWHYAESYTRILGFCLYGSDLAMCTFLRLVWIWGEGLMILWFYHMLGGSFSVFGLKYAECISAYGNFTKWSMFIWKMWIEKIKIPAF